MVVLYSGVALEEVGILVLGSTDCALMLVVGTESFRFGVMVDAEVSLQFGTRLG